MEKSIEELKKTIDDKVKNYGEDSIEVKKYKKLLKKVIEMNEKLKKIGLDK